MPQDTSTRRRTYRLKFRVSPAELETVVGHVPAGQNFSAWARSVLLRESGYPEPNVELTRQVAAIGNNLNQIARALNTAAKGGRAIDVLAVAAELRATRAALEALAG